MFERVFFVVLLGFCGACQSAEPPKVEQPIESLASVDEVPLESLDRSAGIEEKQARIWNRMAEIDDELKRQRAKIQVLERGLMLGIIPDELKHPDDIKFARRVQESTDQVFEKAPDSNQKMVELKRDQQEAATKGSAQGEDSAKSFTNALLEAQKYFDEGRYGRAIHAYEELGVSYPHQTRDGSLSYWIGLSWYHLKDYDQARNHFNNLRKDYTQSPWIPKSLLYQARIDRHLGLKERAFKTLQELMQTYPDDEAAKMAQRDFALLEKSL